MPGRSARDGLLGRFEARAPRAVPAAATGLRTARAPGKIPRSRGIPARVWTPGAATHNRLERVAPAPFLLVRTGCNWV